MVLSYRSWPGTAPVTLDADNTATVDVLAKRVSGPRSTLWPAMGRHGGFGVAPLVAALVVGIEVMDEGNHQVFPGAAGEQGVPLPMKAVQELGEAVGVRMASVVFKAFRLSSARSRARKKKGCGARRSITTIAA